MYDRLCRRTLLLQFLEFWELPLAVDDLFARLVHAYRVIPALTCGQTIDTPILTSTKMDRKSSTLLFPRSNIIEAIQVAIVLLDEALLVVDRDRPK